MQWEFEPSMTDPIISSAVVETGEDHQAAVKKASETLPEALVCIILIQPQSGPIHRPPVISSLLRSDNLF
jgi:hypothetical protein